MDQTAHLVMGMQHGSCTRTTHSYFFQKKCVKFGRPLLYLNAFIFWFVHAAKFYRKYKWKVFLAVQSNRCSLCFQKEDMVLRVRRVSHQLLRPPIWQLHPSQWNPKPAVVIPQLVATASLSSHQKTIYIPPIISSIRQSFLPK